MSLRAPLGFWWCLGASGRWHLLLTARVPADGPVTWQTACGRWPSLGLDLAWRRAAPSIPLEDTPKVRPRCAAPLRAICDRDRLVTPPAEQPRLFRPGAPGEVNRRGRTVMMATHLREVPGLELSRATEGDLSLIHI